ncbi:hydrogen peroxide-inducible genes activator [Pontixanthobacter aestiaquae]|uniref:LysR family transcriptional regulator n=1 Tax=Pontixanthobacter aestiaquae TaxID=1509367 RepID=A0A844Z6E3_9SPHN|nr:hydrogen peroxide-inducible genes activator [Pontixanthobacter aestiaquae]MDN3645933.1 hydrogen peroxide-inducible genes activator [Pontixanthobacter aestiaquae]MXO83074.1 LysR family transcriptional regulator [Pontixanthobacter aestiaquae]
MPTLRQLQYLVAIEDTEHFGRAADSVNVTQPTLSQQLKELELRLGTKLVERGRPVRLTPIGREISSRARKVMRDMEEIRAIADRGQNGMAGTIRLGVSPTIGPYLMPHVVVRLHKDFPDLKLYIREGIPADQFAELRNGRLDMMLAPLPVLGSELHSEPLFREPLQLVGAPDHPLVSKPALTMEDFAGQPVLSLDRRHPSHQQAERICEEMGAELLRDYEGTSLDSLRQMAGSGLGLAILPELYLRSETGGEDMVRRFEIKGWSQQRSIAAIWREGAAFADSYAAIAEVVAAEAREILA